MHITVYESDEKALVVVDGDQSDLVEAITTTINVTSEELLVDKRVGDVFAQAHRVFSVGPLPLAERKALGVALRLLCDTDIYHDHDKFLE